MDNLAISKKLLRGLERAFEQENISLKQVIHALKEDEKFPANYRLVLMSLLITTLITKDERFKFTLFEPPKSQETIRNEFASKYGLNMDDIETIFLLAKGKTDREISRELKIITTHGVIGRVRKALYKTQTENRVQLAVLAAKEGLI